MYSVVRDGERLKVFEQTLDAFAFATKASPALDAVIIHSTKWYTANVERWQNVPSVLFNHLMSLPMDETSGTWWDVEPPAWILFEQDTRGECGTLEAMVERYKGRVEEIFDKSELLAVRRSTICPTDVYRLSIAGVNKNLEVMYPPWETFVTILKHVLVKFGAMA